MTETGDQYRELLDSVEDLIQSVGPDGSILFVNRSWRVTLRYPEADLGSLRFADIVHPESRECFEQMWAHLLAGNPGARVEMKLQAKDGRAVWVEASSTCKFREGRPEAVRTVFHDVTSRRRAEKAFSEVQTLSRTILNNANVAIVSTTSEGTIMTFNAAAERWLGYTAAEAIGRATPVLFHDPEELRRRAAELTIEQDRYVPADMESLLLRPRRGEREQAEWSWIRKDGSRFPVSLTVSPLREETGNVAGYLFLASDITELKRAEEALRDLSLTDELTGLRNRRGFTELAEQQLKLARRKGKDVLLVFADMDGLKEINDRCGHQEGSEAIARTADILRKTFRSTDIIARMGGDEFTVLVVDADPGNGKAIMSRLERNLDRYNEQHLHPFEISLSVGMVTIEPGSTETVDEMLVKADAAMYEHKRAKKKARAS